MVNDPTHRAMNQSWHRLSGRVITCALSLLVVFGVGLLVGGASADAANAYGVPPAQVARVQTIALAPVDATDRFELSASITSDLERRFTAALEEKGYRVVPSQHWAAAWQRNSELVGGVYDPVSGEPDKEKAGIVSLHTAELLATEFKADAVLHLFVTVGVENPPAVFPPTKGAFVKALRGGPFFDVQGERLHLRGGPLEGYEDRPQRAEMSVLSARLEDLAGVRMFFDGALLEWIRVYVARGFEDRPKDELFADPARLDSSIARTLSALVPSQAP
jgi:hypothetical protein